MSARPDHWEKVLIGIAFKRDIEAGANPTLSALIRVAQARGFSPRNALEARKALGRVPSRDERHQVMFFGRSA